MTGHLMHAMDKQRAYYRYRNQLRLQIRRRDYCAKYLNRPTIQADTLHRKLDSDIYENFKENDKPLNQAIKDKLREYLYLDIVQVSKPDEELTKLVVDERVIKYEVAFKDQMVQNEKLMQSLAEYEKKVHDLEAKLKNK